MSARLLTRVDNGREERSCNRNANQDGAVGGCDRDGEGHAAGESNQHARSKPAQLGAMQGGGREAEG